MPRAAAVVDGLRAHDEEHRWRGLRDMEGECGLMLQLGAVAFVVEHFWLAFIVGIAINILSAGGRR